MYTDRPLYKPGDKIYFKWLARLFSITWYKKASYKTGKLELLDDNYKVINSKEISLDENANFSWEFSLAKEASLWDIFSRFSVNGREILNNREFYIEEYVKPVLKLI